MLVPVKVVPSLQVAVTAVAAVCAAGAIPAGVAGAVTAGVAAVVFAEPAMPGAAGTALCGAVIGSGAAAIATPHRAVIINARAVLFIWFPL